MNDDGNFRNGGNFRNVRNDRNGENVRNVRNVGNVGNVENVRNVILYITKPNHTKYHQISNNNKSTNFQPVADIVLLCLFLPTCVKIPF